MMPIPNNARHSVCGRLPIEIGRGYKTVDEAKASAQAWLDRGGK